MSDIKEKTKEFDEQTIKVLFAESCSFQLNDEKTSVKSGQTINIPRNMAHLLEKEGKGTIQYDDIFSELKQTLSKEKMVGEFELSTIDEFFYMKLNEFLHTLTGNQKESFMDLMNELFRMRNGKIIKFASTSLHLLDKLTSKLSIEEIIFLQQISNSSKILKDSIFPKNEVTES